MKLPTSTHPSALSPTGIGRSASDRPRRPAVASPLPEIVEESGDKVYVAVGKSAGKAVALIQWAVRWFVNREICVLHVHQPSPFIPTLLGKLPASHANNDVVAAFRREEREETRKLLSNYLSACSKLKVQASTITTEADQILKGIVDLVKKHNIRRLVIGATPDNCIKVKKSSSKASYAAKNVPSFCQIWFVSKGKLLWTRDASEGSSSVALINSVDLTAYKKNSSSSDTNRTRILSISSSFSSCSGSAYSSSTEQKASSDSEMKFEEQSLCSILAEVKSEAETSKNEASKELLERKKLEFQALEAIRNVKAFESAYAHEHELRKGFEDILQTTIQERAKVLEENEKITDELRMAMRTIALLDSRARESNHRLVEAQEEIRLIQASIATLRGEKQRIQLQKINATHWLTQWRNRGQTADTNIFKIAYNETKTKFTEFLLIDLETATCKFSESFKIGQGEHGIVYKGEILDRTVAVKMLHPHNMHRQSEFQQEVEVIGKLNHPHVASMIGICPESWSLVYEYYPNGSLENLLLHRRNTSPFTWKIRARIIAEIASALLFLHSFVPEKIIHGALKPQNILFDSDLSCKISDIGITRLVPEHPLRCPSFRQFAEPKGALSYRDPESHRTGVLSTKSDLYSFGLIILQLLTGRTLISIASGVRKALSCGKLASILDPSAGEWPTFVVRRLVDLGLQCCELNSTERPELTPILVKELAQLQVLEERTVPYFFLCPIVKEIMHDPQIAADGFTYEGDALRVWLENGHETSPMTNLKLSHLQLTPNYALRQAIRDWLCKS